MAPYYRQLLRHPTTLTPLSVDDLKGSFQGHESENERRVLTVAPRPMVPINKYVHLAQLIKLHLDL